MPTLGDPRLLPRWFTSWTYLYPARAGAIIIIRKRKTQKLFFRMQTFRTGALPTG